MSTNVRITKSGLQSYKWSPEEQRYIEEEIPSFLQRIRVACEIDDGVTLKDVLLTLSEHRDLVPIVSAYAWCDVDAFIAEIQRKSLSKSELSFIEISKICELHRAGIYDFAGENIDVHGRVDGEETYYALDLTPVNDLAVVPVRLSKKYSVTNEHKEVASNDGAWFSLLDVLGEIFYEISFHGTPADRDEFGADLKDAYEDAMAHPERLVPFEPVKEDVN